MSILSAVFPQFLHNFLGIINVTEMTKSLIAQASLHYTAWPKICFFYIFISKLRYSNSGSR